MDFTRLAWLILLIQEYEGLKHCPKEVINITVKWGSTAHLPCPFLPPKVVAKEGVQVSWQKEHGGMDLVVHFQNGKEEGDQQHEHFRGRTKVARSWYRDGSANLDIYRVTEKDSGIYTCWITLLPVRMRSQYKCCVVILNISERTALPSNDGYQFQDNVIAWIFVFISIGLLSALPCLLIFRRNTKVYRTLNCIL